MRLCLLIASLMFATSSMGSDKLPWKVSQMGIGINTGISHLNTQAFNLYTPANVRNFKKDQFLFGAEGFARFDKCMIGLGAGIAKGDKIKNDTFDYTLSGGTITFNWAYQLSSKKQWLCFPMASAGFSAYGIGIDQKIQAYQSEMVSNSRRSLHISNAGVVTDLSMNIYRLLNYSATEGVIKKQSFSQAIGLKIGYMYGFKNSSWTYTGGSVTEGPKFGMRMVYLKICIGSISHSAIKQ
ncbi:MAG: hypothetical protein ACKOXF_03200 [Chitinophagaceae bacterium]